MWPFNTKCEHPLWALQTQKEQTVTIADEDFEHVDYHFQCSKCGAHITKSHARTIGGVSAFMERGRQRMKAHNVQIEGQPAFGASLSNAGWTTLETT